MSLDDVDGFNLLDHFYTFAKRIAEGPGLRDERKGRYLKVTSVEGRGNCVLLETESGGFGESASTYDTSTGNRIRENKPEEAFARRTHSALYFLPRSEMAVFVKEHKFGAQTGWMLMEEFKQALLHTYEGFWLPTEVVQEDSAWTADALLEEITVVEHHAPLNLSTGTDPGRKNETVVGRLSHSALPPKGVKHFTKKIQKSLFSGAMDPVSFVGLRSTIDQSRPGDGDPDVTVMVRMELDGRRKTFELGVEATPSVRELLTDHGEAPLDLDGFHARSLEMAAELYKRESYTLSHKDCKTVWATDRSLPTWTSKWPLTRGRADGDAN